MADLAQRLDRMEEMVRKPSFRESIGRANAVNHWIFDYPPGQELEVRERVRQLERKNDIMIDYLESKDFLEKCVAFEQKQGLERIARAVNSSMKINDADSLIVRHIREHTPENAVVFLTGIGKCYPILRSHKVLHTLRQSFGQVPVVLFYPGVYDEQQLLLFGKIKDDNYFQAFRLVK